MARFVRHTWMLVFLFIALLSVVLLVRRTQPSALSVLFTNPDGTPCQRPCLFGVQPGKTSYERAIALLKMHSFTHSFQPDIERGTFSGPGMSVIVFWKDDNRVSQISLLRTPGAAPFAWGSLGEMIAVLGPPDVVGIDAEFTRSYYLTGSMMFFHDRIKPAYVNMDEPFDTLTVFDHVLSVPSDPHISAWQGFSSIRHYQVANPRLLDNPWTD